MNCYVEACRTLGMVHYELFATVLPYRMNCYLVACLTLLIVKKWLAV